MLWVKNQQNLRIDTGFVSTVKLVHFAKFVNAFEKSDVFLIPEYIKNKQEHDSNKAMSTEAILDEPPEAGLAWITLLLSASLLGALIVWSLQNPSVLLPSMSAEQTNAPYNEQSSENTKDINAAKSEVGNPVFRSAQSNNIESANEKRNTVESDTPVSAEAVNSAEAAELAATPLEKLRRQELATLPGLAGRVRYNPGESDPLEGSDKLLNRMFELLFLYIDSEVVVKISSGDYEDDIQNLELSNIRAQKLIAYLVDRGLDEQRFEIVPMGREALPLGGHRVNMYAKNI